MDHPIIKSINNYGIYLLMPTEIGKAYDIPIIEGETIFNYTNRYCNCIFRIVLKDKVNILFDEFEKEINNVEISNKIKSYFISLISSCKSIKIEELNDKLIEL